jgi:hypothetical protein
MNCVYLLRYNNWENDKWKIGCSKNIKDRLKSYQTSNGKMPDTVFILNCNDSAQKEKEYHFKYKNYIKDNKREHFILSRSIIFNLLTDGFELFYGTFLVDYNKDLILLKNQYDNELKLLQQKLKDTTCLLIKIDQANSRDILIKNHKQLFNIVHQELIKYFSNKPQILVSKLDTLTEKIKKVIPPTFTERINTELFNFLTNHIVYKKDNIVFIEEIRKNISTKFHKSISKLNNHIFYQVNKEYIIEEVKVCKHCNKKSSKLCCKDYNSNERTKKKIMKHGINKFMNKKMIV